MARPKLGDSDTERLHIKITAEEIKAVEDWRYANRVPSRSEAFRRLVQLGLNADQETDAIAAEARQIYDDIVRKGDLSARAMSEDPQLASRMALTLINDLMEVATGHMLRAVHLAAQTNALRSKEGDPAALQQDLKKARAEAENTLKNMHSMFAEASAKKGKK